MIKEQLRLSYGGTQLQSPLWILISPSLPLQPWTFYHFLTLNCTRHILFLFLPYSYNAGFWLIETVKSHCWLDFQISRFIRNSRFFICQIFFSGYGHRHISGSLNFIKNIFRIFGVRPFSSMTSIWYVHACRIYWNFLYHMKYSISGLLLHIKKN